MSSCMCAGMGVRCSGDLICPFVQQPWKLLVFETCLSSHPMYWMRENILCGVRNIFILWCLWIFDLYVCYALLLLSLVRSMAAEEQLGHEILILMWKKKENETSYSHISARNIYSWRSERKRPYPHCGLGLSPFCTCPNKHDCRRSQNTLFRVRRPCVRWMRWHVPRNTRTGFRTEQTTCKAAMQNKVDGKGSICVSKGSWKKVLFQSSAITFAYLEMQGDHRIKKKKSYFQQGSTEIAG